MNALTLLIIRHAEKPADPGAPGPDFGLTEAGAQDTDSLIIPGWQRAGAWAALFGGGVNVPGYPVPAQVFAAAPGPENRLDHGPSRRPYQTALPLAERLGLAAPDTSFAKGDEAALVAKLLTLTGVVLVAWEHDAIISDIVTNLPVSSGTPPDAWPGNRFDVVLRYDRPEGATEFAYRMLFPQLLDGDKPDWP